MNKIQFWVLIGLSSLALIFVITNIVLIYTTSSAQLKLAQVQQALTVGQNEYEHLFRLAARVYNDSQKTGDQALKDIVTRQQIKPQDTQQAPAATDSSAPATNSAAGSSTTH